MLYMWCTIHMLYAKCIRVCKIYTLCMCYKIYHSICYTSAVHLLHICYTSATHLLHICYTSATHVLYVCYICSLQGYLDQVGTAGGIGGAAIYRMSQCSLNVHWTFTECSLNAPWMCPEWSLQGYLDQVGTAGMVYGAVCGGIGGAAIYRTYPRRGVLPVSIDRDVPAYLSLFTFLAFVQSIIWMNTVANELVYSTSIYLYCKRVCVCYKRRSVYSMSVLYAYAKGLRVCYVYSKRQRVFYVYSELACILSVVS
jgi:hypothetical protein